MTRAEFSTQHVKNTKRHPRHRRNISSLSSTGSGFVILKPSEVVFVIMVSGGSILANNLQIFDNILDQLILNSYFAFFGPETRHRSKTSSY